MIDWSVSVGNILTMITIVAGSLAAFFSVKSDVRVIKHDMNNLAQRQEIVSESLAQITTILVTLAGQEERIKGLENDFRDLRHGKGFIK